MTNGSTANVPIGKTLVDFLRMTVEKHGPSDALLIKPVFRYLRWSYSRGATPACGKSPEKWLPCSRAAA